MKGRNRNIYTQDPYALSFTVYFFLLVFMSISKEIKDSEEITKSCN